MIIVSPSWSWEFCPTDAYERIERIGRTCYKSEDRIGLGTAERFVRMLRERGHTAMFDHVSASVRFVVDRGVTHELVRHRIAGYAQESTRFCNYSKGKFDGQVTFVRPCFWAEDAPQYRRWLSAVSYAEEQYLCLLDEGASPQEARSVLPNSLKTEIVATMDFTAWRHCLKLRTSPAAHPQIREVMIPLLVEFKRLWPAVFEDISND